MKNKKRSARQTAKQRALFELRLDEAVAINTPREEIFTKLISWGVPEEFVFRFGNLWDQTCRIGRRILHIGKLVVLRIVEFVEAHPGLSIGVLLGAAIGALAGSIPLIGALLAPLAKVVMTTFGALLGNECDSTIGTQPGGPAKRFSGTIGNLIDIARSFFHLFIQIIMDVVSDVQRSEMA